MKLERLDNLFHAAREMPAAAWESYLEEQCAGDTDLAETVLAMLRNEGEAFAWFAEAENTLGMFWEEVAPAKIGQYRVLRVLGRGGMGTVYLAERDGEEFQQTVAVKCMRREGAEVLRRFLAERRILSRMEHPGIARLMDGGRMENGEPYFVMEYVAGEPLSDWIAKGPTEAERLRLFRRVGEAVEYAHRHLVVHRDLKPSNILVTAEGQPKLLDFGIARLLDETLETGPSPLTPRYAAPEQLSGGAVTTLTDVYGMGLLLRDLLGGKRPDGELGQIVAKALEIRPEDRYRSVSELLDDVRAYETGQPVHAHGLGWMYRAAKYARRHWIGVGFIAALLGAVALLAMQSWRLEQERERARLVAHIVPELFAGAGAREALEKNLPALRVRYAGQPLLWAELLEAGGHTCRAAGERGRAAALYQEALEIRRRILGERHSDVVETKRHLEETRQ
jgi:serine/threonine-protein kinase